MRRQPTNLFSLRAFWENVVCSRSSKHNIARCQTCPFCQLFKHPRLLLPVLTRRSIFPCLLAHAVCTVLLPQHCVQAADFPVERIRRGQRSAEWRPPRARGGARTNLQHSNNVASVFIACEPVGLRVGRAHLSATTSSYVRVGHTACRNGKNHRLQ